MKKNFTFRKNCSLILTFVLVIFSLPIIAQTTHQVSVTSNVFTPKELTIAAGDEVVWTNTQGTHNVNGTQTAYPSNPASFGNDLGSGWTYKFTFNTAGTYDYKCDPHVGFGMVGKIIVNPKVEEPLKLTVNFTGMTPHVGQTLWLAVVDQSTKIELLRVKKAVTAAVFSIEIPGIESGSSYNVDFYSDHNKNGVYDAPPADHAWRRQISNVTGNSTLDFAHNTGFTDISWQNKLTVHFTGMTPHVGQKLTLFLKQSDTGIYKDTLVMNPVPGAIFDMSSYQIMPGESYKIDFYADHNKNSVYDAPPVDHAWRISLNNVLEDTIVNFAHNTGFTNIFDLTSVPVIPIYSGQNMLFPNPASNYVELKLSPDFSLSGSIIVYSISGSVVKDMKFSGITQSEKYDIGELNKGIYFLEINSGSKKVVLKFVKQ